MTPHSRLKDLQQYLEQDPQDSFTRYAIAMEYASLKDIPSAISNLEELMKHDSTYLPAYHQLGTLLFNTQKYDEAIKILEQGVTLGLNLGEHHAVSEMEELIDEIMDEIE